MAMGCGKMLDLPREKKLFCCKQFNLDCPTIDNVLNVRPVSEAASERLETWEPKRATIRLLGEDCKEENVKCATGLYCRRGICVRTRSKAHFDALIQRGKFIEVEERNDIDVASDEEREDPLPVQKGLILEGQAVTSSRADIRPEKKNNDKTMAPRKTPTPKIPLPNREFATDASKDNGRHSARSNKPLNEEEDELAANIADLLSSKLGIFLNSKERHSVREMIAGTLDERAEREDQTAENTIESNNQGPSSGLEQRVEAAEGDGPQTYHYYNHYEPLVQCPSARKHNSLRNEISESLKNLADKSESMVNARI